MFREPTEPGVQSAAHKARELLQKKSIPANARDVVALIPATARVVLIGESTHGSNEFYAFRAEIAKLLIKSCGFVGVAVEGDWPDCSDIHRYVTGLSPEIRSANEAMKGFERFPTWMWRNDVTAEFVEWLREHNAPLPPDQRCGFFGLDLYSLQSSMEAVNSFLEKEDPPMGRIVRSLYSCFDEFGGDVQRTYATWARTKTDQHGKSGRSAAAAAAAALKKIAAKTPAYSKPMDGIHTMDAAFINEENAKVVVKADEYYRAQFAWDASSWNVRDSSMDDTLFSIREYLKKTRKSDRVVVFAHNSHVQDARASRKGRSGELTLGQLVREQAGTTASFLIGQFTYTGSVTAAPDWGEQHKCFSVTPALPGSYEDLLHMCTKDGKPFVINLRDEEVKAALAPAGRAGGAALGAASANPERLQRAIGVVYRKDTEPQSHYLSARLGAQFDAVVFFDETHALKPLDAREWPAAEPETYPSGL